MADIRLVNVANAYRGMAHQTAALNWLQERIPSPVLAEFAELWRSDPPAKPEASPSPGIDWLTPCTALVQEFEGCRLDAYPDPGTGGDPWTIGWGHTGPEVRRGVVWSQPQADAVLRLDLLTAHQGMLVALPMASEWNANRQAALTSFAFNVGISALQGSTLRQRLLSGEDPTRAVADELPRWNKGGNGVLPGLVRRRAAEVALFCGGSVPATAVLLKVPYEFQADNTSGTGFRECFSSSCAMVARFYGKVGSDDEYNRIRARFGDTTDSGAQLRALGSLGLQAGFRQNGSASTLETILREGRPIPVGWLHQGPISKPTGGGHWSVVIGFDADAFTHHDPNGEADLVNGGYVSTSGSAGKGIRYGRKNWLRRWEADGRGSGWYLDVRP
jgi:GH24 family phage-related lysozyme (muramidase)